MTLLIILVVGEGLCALPIVAGLVAIRKRLCNFVGCGALDAPNK